MASGGGGGLEPQLFLAKPLRDEIACRKSRVSLPFVCMNNNGYVVVFYEYDNHIYCVVGKINQGQPVNEKQEIKFNSFIATEVTVMIADFSKINVNQGTEDQAQLKIDWGLENDYGDGCKVQACLTDDNVLVFVREHKWIRECFCSTGTVTDSLTIDWTVRDQFLCKGINPTMAISRNTVLFLHEAAYGLSHSFYTVYELNGSRILKLKGPRDCKVPGLDGYKRLCVAVNSNGDLVISCRLAFTNTLHYAVGKLEGNSLSGLSAPKEYASGNSPRVCLLEDGKVVELHESMLSSGLYYRSGNLQPDQGDIAWQKSRDCGNGYYPSIAVNDHHTMVMFHTDLKVCSQLLYRLGTGLFN